jgi:hypothetical protein
VDNHVEAVDRTGFENHPYDHFWLRGYPLEVQDPYANGILVRGDDAHIGKNTVANVTDGIILRTGSRGTGTVVDNTVTQSEATVGVDWDGTNRFHLNSENDGIRVEPLVLASDSTTSAGISVRNNTLTGPSASGLVTTGVSFYTEGNPPTTFEANTIRNHSRGLQLRVPGLTSPVTVESNAITGARDAGVVVSELGYPTLQDGTEPTSVEPIQIHYNRLPAQAEYGVLYENGDATVNATGNYWGAASGPSSPGNTTLADPETGALANGTGSAVSAGSEAGESNVRFDPWLGESPHAAEPPAGGPTVEHLDLAEDDRGNNPHAMFVANWTVSDADGDLETVELTLRDTDDGEVEDSKTVDVGGGTASDDTRLRAHKEGDSGHTYEVELVVTDAANNTASETDTAVAGEDEDDSGEGNSSAPVDPTTTSPDGTTTESGMVGVIGWQPTAGSTHTVARLETGVL